MIGWLETGAGGGQSIAAVTVVATIYGPIVTGSVRWVGGRGSLFIGASIGWFAGGPVGLQHEEWEKSHYSRIDKKINRYVLCSYS